AHTATLLQNGTVLVSAGEATGTTYLGTAEIYDPATGAWTSSGALGTLRAWHTSTLLPNGQVLAAGGENGSLLQNCELFNPATGRWSPTANMTSIHDGHVATLLPNGMV